MSAASVVKDAIEFISKHPDVLVLRRSIGGKAPRQLLQRARADGNTPASLIELCSEMNGLVFEWGFRTPKRASATRVGYIRIPPLARNIQGWSYEDGFGVEDPEIADVIRVLDEAPYASGCSVSPCFAEGSFGLWRHYDDIFDANPPVDENGYLACAAEHLFMSEWFRARCDGDETPAEVAVARERLGMSPLT